MPESTRREPRQRRHLPRIRPGTMPGTLPPRDPGAEEWRRITVIAYTHDTVTETEGKTLEDALAAAGPGVRWINIDGADAGALERLGAHFKLHPLALEDVLSGPQRPKIERYADHYFMILRMLRLASAGQPEIDDEQVSIFFGHDWVVTVQDRP